MLTTVVGNYPKIPNRPRPARLRQAIARLERGEIDQAELKRVQDEVTREVIQEQIEAGIDIVTDGQVRWDDDQTYLMRNWQGVSIGGLQRYLDTNTYYREPQIVGPLSAGETVLDKDFRFAQQQSSRPVKAILPGPYTLAALSKDEHYGDRRTLVMAIAELLRQEALALQAAGATIIQINEPVILTRPEDFPLLAEAIRLLVDGISAETALYTWFGSVAGLYPRLLDLPVTTIGIDFVSRPDNWDAVLKHGRVEKKLAFGVINGRNTRLETAQEIAQAVEKAMQVCEGDQIYVNPSCGLEFLPREVAFEKLKRLAEAVRLAQPV